MIRISAPRIETLEARETILPSIRMILSPIVAHHERFNCERRKPMMFKCISILQDPLPLLFWHSFINIHIFFASKSFALHVTMECVWYRFRRYRSLSEQVMWSVHCQSDSLTYMLHIASFIRYIFLVIETDRQSTSFAMRSYRYESYINLFVFFLILLLNRILEKNWLPLVLSEFQTAQQSDIHNNYHNLIS